MQLKFKLCKILKGGDLKIKSFSRGVKAFDGDFQNIELKYSKHVDAESGRGVLLNFVLLYILPIARNYV